MSDAPLPPRDRELPGLGGTLRLLKNGFAFVDEGTKRHGPIFRTNLFGRPTAVITGPDASTVFIDPARVQRSGAMPAHIETLFAGRSLPLLDGDVHRERKQFVMAGFTREALAAYLPVMQRLVGEALSGWAAKREVRLLDECKRLSIETICLTVLGLSRGEVLDAVLADYDLVLAGFASLPVPLPGTTFTRAKLALGRILAVFEACVRMRQAAPQDDGVSRILAARGSDGRPIGVAEAVRELHHIVVAGLIVWAWFLTGILELSRRPEDLERLRSEIRASGAEGALALETLERMHGLQRTSMEIRRLSPVVHVFFGRAKETFDFKGFRVPKGWMVLWGHRTSHLAPEVYAKPGEFDPSRFALPREEHRKHEHAFVPNGAGPPSGHKCAGWEFAPLFLQVFLVELVRGTDVTLEPSQDLTYDWSRVPPEPRDGLRARVTRRPA